MDWTNLLFRRFAEQKLGNPLKPSLSNNVRLRTVTIALISNDSASVDLWANIGQII